jgi:hypothetical protein
METGERMEALARAKASAVQLKGTGGITELGTEQSVDLDQAQAIVVGWPQAPKAMALKLLEAYGPPNEATPTKLFWYRNGPWRRIVITADEVAHDFPTPHTDYLTQYVDYRVPPEAFSELARFDGSVLVDRTAGEMGARCDMEAMNVLTLNLAHEVVTGRRSVEEARAFYAETAAAYAMSREAPYAEKLLFEPPRVTDAVDPDAKMIAPSLARQAAEKVKDVAGAGGTGPTRRADVKARPAPLPAHASRGWRREPAARGRSPRPSAGSAG